MANILPQTSRTTFLAFKDLRCSKKSKRQVLAGGTSLQGSEAKLDQNVLLQNIVELLFNIPPVWKLAVNKARKKIAERGKLIGISQADEIEAIRSMVPSWDQELARVQDESLQYPEYYSRPFHAYDQGNLSWEAAFQLPSTAKLVHAPVMDPENRAMDPDGDDNMRQSYSRILTSFLGQMGTRVPNDIVDIGCATGLSTMELSRCFPQANIQGIDLSPYFLAVAKVLHEQQGKENTKGRSISFIHGMAEDTKLESSSVDLVSAYLLFHEIPAHAARRILAEAFRVLRPNGTLAIMEMNPVSDRFQRMLRNPMAYVPFKATEPWLEEYIALDLRSELQRVGFRDVRCEPSTPGHLTLAARRPK